MAVFIVTGDILRVSCERFAGTVIKHDGTVAEAMRARQVKSLGEAVELCVYGWLARELTDER